MLTIDSKSSRALRLGVAMATFTLLVIAQLQTNVSSIGPESSSGPSDLSLTVTGILIIKDKGPISVNGANVPSGTTVLSGNSIESSLSSKWSWMHRSKGHLDKRGDRGCNC